MVFESVHSNSTIVRPGLAKLGVRGSEPIRAARSDMVSMVEGQSVSETDRSSHHVSLSSAVLAASPTAEIARSVC